MLRLCGLLLWVALRCAVQIGIDALVKAWLAIRPIRRWRTRRAMKAWRDEHGGPPDEVREDFHDVPPDEDFMSEAQQSFLRGLLKFAAGALVAKGVIDVGDAAGLQVALEALVGGVVGLWAFWQSHRKHAA